MSRCFFDGMNSIATGRSASRPSDVTSWRRGVRRTRSRRLNSDGMNSIVSGGTAFLILIMAALSSSVQAQNKPATGSEATKPGQTTVVPKPETGGGVAGTIQLRKEVQGEFLYRFVPKTGASTSPTALPAPSGNANLLPLNIPAGLKPAETTLEIMDMQKGNAARLPVKTTGETPLTESSFTYAQSVTVPVQQGGKPVSGVQVTLESGD